MRSILLCAVLWAGAVPSVRAQTAYDYGDDFSGTKAQDDSWQASLFWPSDINNPPLRPYLSYRGTGAARGLLFMDFRGELAQLSYDFVASPVPAGGLVRATLALDVSFPCSPEVPQYPPGQLLYSTSADAVVWSAPQSLSVGHHEILLLFTGGVCYVRLSGTHAALDHLRLSPAAPGTTIRIATNDSAHLPGAGAAPSIFHVDWREGRDGNDGKSRATAFKTIQAALNAKTVLNGSVVVVWPGTYQEEVLFNGKAVTVQSAADAAVIMAPKGYAFSFFKAEGRESLLANLVITGCGAGGVFCDNGASPTLRNLTIADNRAGVVAYGGANPYLVNCILWQNANAQLAAPKANFNWQMFYSCVGPNNPSTVEKAKHNFTADPLFAEGDYHLKSEWGRYVPLTNTWVFDHVTSPCLDAGDPVDTPRAEGELNGWQINVGAYGGTPFASHSGSGPTCE